MLQPQLMFPQNFSVDYGNTGTMVNVGQKGGPQGNPNGSMQPRPYPVTDAVGNINSFGMRLIPPGYGQANWLANLPVNNRIANAGINGDVQNLIKQPSAQTQF